MIRFVKAYLSDDFMNFDYSRFVVTGVLMSKPWALPTPGVYPL
jgi:hypothetical protein